MMQTATTEILKPQRKKTILFEINQHWTENLLRNGDESLASLLPVMGKPLIVYNVEKILQKDKSIDQIFLPREFSSVAALLKNAFSALDIQKYGDVKECADLDPFRIPLNSAVLVSESGYVVKPIVYPWDILRLVLEIIRNEVRFTSISEKALISDTAVIKGPCVIEDGVSIDDFTKISGPVYIGKNSKIGTGNLVRECVIGEDSMVGFGCEIARSVLAGKNKISHHDVILDSIVGQNTWMGAFVGTTNLLLNNEAIKFRLGNNFVSTGLEHFGAVIGRDCAIGAGVIILPGRNVPKNSTIQAGTIISK
ncbi:MAG TPA: hypothetical protein VJ792_09375 [Candidatus Nitrosotalea sp.]|nr:hypothetical protein [Candidatus Nitrosotalea sp.]